MVQRTEEELKRVQKIVEEASELVGEVWRWGRAWQALGGEMGKLVEYGLRFSIFSCFLFSCCFLCDGF